MDKQIAIKVKVCGMRQAANIRAVESLGVDFMGFIFYPKSPRYVGEAPPSYLPGSCRRVGVFVDASVQDIMNRVKTFSLEAVQLHGTESPGQCLTLKGKGLQVIKAFPVATASDLRHVGAYIGTADYFLFDTRCAGHGGSGRRFDWSVLTHYTGSTPFLLSGGIGPDSLLDLKDFSHPAWAGIDLNSGFESAPGMKDVTLLKEFINHLKNETL